MIRPRSEAEKLRLLRELMIERFGPLPTHWQPRVQLREPEPEDEAHEPVSDEEEAA
jgi:hypothetical protein